MHRHHDHRIFPDSSPNQIKIQENSSLKEYIKKPITKAVKSQTLTLVLHQDNELPTLSTGRIMDQQVLIIIFNSIFFYFLISIGRIMDQHVLIIKNNGLSGPNHFQEIKILI